MPLTESEELELLELELLESEQTAPVSKAMMGEIRATPTFGEKALGVGEEIAKTTPEIVGGIAGGVVGSLAGPGPSRVLGTLGATAGKEVQQYLGFEEDQSFLDNLGESAVEEAIGVGITKIARPIARASYPFLQPTLQRLGFKRAATAFDNLVITNADLDPTKTGGRTVIEAQENLLGERNLLAFEEVSGRAGGVAERKLLSKMQISREFDNRETAFQKVREARNKTIATQLRGGGVEPSVVLGNTRQSLDDNITKLGKDLDALEPKLAALRESTQVEARGVVQAIEEQRSLLQQAVGSDKANALVNKIVNTFTDEAGNLKETVSLADIKIMESSIKEGLPAYKDNAVVQSQLSGLYAKRLQPVIGKLKAGANSTVAAQEGLFARKATLKKSLENYKKQINKSGVKAAWTKTPTLTAAENWKNFETTMLSAGEDEVVRLARQDFKNDVVKKLFTKATHGAGREVSAARADVLLKDRDVLEAVAGNQYTQLLEDARLIAEAQTTTRAFIPRITAQGEREKLGREAARTALGSVFSRINLISGVFDKTSREILFGDVADSAVLKAITGAKGQAIIERAMADPLGTPQAYNNFVQIAREIYRASGKAHEVMSYNEFLQLNSQEEVDAGVGKINSLSTTFDDNLTVKEFDNEFTQEPVEEVMPAEGERMFDLPPVVTGPDGQPSSTQELLQQEGAAGEVDTGKPRDEIGTLIQQLETGLAKDVEQPLLELLEMEEGVRLKSYKDKLGVKTVGVGFNMEQENAKGLWDAAGVQTSFEDVLAGRKEITEEESRNLLRITADSALESAQSIIPEFEELTPNRQAILISMVFQLGKTGADKFKGMKAAIAKGDYSKAADEMLDSRWAKQTPERAQRAALMMREDISEAEAREKVA